MRTLTKITAVCCLILTDIITISLAGVSSPPVWNLPVEKSFNLEYTDISGCDDVTTLQATPSSGESVDIWVISEGPEAGFDTVRIDNTTAKLICDQTRIRSGTVYFVGVRAMDMWGQFKDISLVITAVKTSNNRPVFVRPDPDQSSENHKINLPETSKGGDVVLWLEASDLDTAIALLTYSMDKSEIATKELFEVNGNAIKVKADVVAGTFDYEKKDAILKYPIVLEVSDGLYSSSVSTNIFVDDVNDNAPVFEPITDVEVYESSVAGTTVVHVVATDADGTTENSQVKYTLTGSTDFSINASTGVISVASGATLNFDTKSAYTLTITATDDVPGAALSSKLPIVVKVVTKPKFVNLATDTSVSVKDNATADTTVFVLTVTDKDQASAPVVTIVNQTTADVFVLDVYTLKLKPGVTLDAGTNKEYQLVFKADDGNIQVFSAVLTVIVEATETNTVNPAVQRVMSEDAPAGAFVAKIRVDGLNEENNIIFSMIGDSAGDFIINPVTGEISVATDAQLDYTNKIIYTLIVTATDGVASVDTPVIIYIRTSPRFVDPSNSLPSTTLISVREDTPAKSKVKRLTASDEDGDTLIFSIITQIPTTDKPVFDTRGSDLITAKSNSVDTLDVDAADAVQTYELQIRVSDGRYVSVNDTVNVTITITDSNEHPIFSSELTPGHNIMEETESGSSVFSVIAIDNDRTPENRQIKYSLSGTRDFDINEDTGEITVAVGTVLNHTTMPVYSLTVTATDSGLPPMSSSVNLTFTILKVGCSMLTDVYGTWPLTKAGELVTVGCEDLYIGNYSRICDVSGEWGEVSSQCKLQASVFKELQQQVSLIANSSEDVSSDIEDVLENLTKIAETHVDEDVIENSLQILENIFRIVENTKNATVNSTQYFFETISNLMKPENEEAWTRADVQGSEILDIVDSYIDLLQEITCNGLNIGEVNQIEKDHLYTEIGRKSGNVGFPSIKQTGAVIDIPEITLINSGLTNVCFGGAFYNTLGDIMDEQMTNGTVALLPSGEVNSDIIAIQIYTETGAVFRDLNPPIRITFTLKNPNYSNPVCVFWDYNTTVWGSHGAWSSEGCVLEEITNTTATCSCSHLTNFAILMSPSKISDKHSVIIGIISAVGCAVSMVCLILTIIAHWMVWRIVRSNRTITLMHLCVALLLAFGVFLAGVNRTESRVACVIIAALIQFLFLTVFFLMLFIGIDILLSVVHVFGTRPRFTKFLLVAWLAPGVVVGVSLGVTKTEGYGNDRFCWLDIESGLIWSFIGPAAGVIFFNVVIIVIVFKKMSSAAFVKSKTSAVKTKTWLHSLCVLLPMLGITWLFGLLSVNSDMFILQYMFSIFNSLQGMFIFLFHCVFNRQIRAALKQRKERRRTLATLDSELRNTSKEEHS